MSRKVQAKKASDGALLEGIRRAARALDGCNSREAAERLEPFDPTHRGYRSCRFPRIVRRASAPGPGSQQEAEVALWTRAWEEAEKASPELEENRPPSLAQQPGAPRPSSTSTLPRRLKRGARK